MASERRDGSYEEASLLEGFYAEQAELTTELRKRARGANDFELNERLRRVQMRQVGIRNYYAQRVAELEADAGLNCTGTSVYWVRAEDELYALKGAYRRDLSCFLGRGEAEAMDTDDALWQITVERF